MTISKGVHVISEGVHVISEGYKSLYILAYLLGSAAWSHCFRQMNNKSLKLI